jgi:hypothetical protein
MEPGRMSCSWLMDGSCLNIQSHWKNLPPDIATVSPKNIDWDLETRSTKDRQSRSHWWFKSVFCALRMSGDFPNLFYHVLPHFCFQWNQRNALCQLWSLLWSRGMVCTARRLAPLVGGWRRGQLSKGGAQFDPLTFFDEQLSIGP